MTTSRRRIPINNQAPATHTSADQASTSRASVDHAGVPRATEASSPEAPGCASPGNGAAGPPELHVAELEAVEEVLLQAQAALDKATEERDASAESLLRLRAEFENYRKRATRELVQARDRAQGELLSDLLPVLDNLERALDAAEHHEEGKVLGGVRMTRDMFVELLRRSGVEEIETVGARFDPAVHEALLLQPSEREEGIVTAVLERGYRQGEHVLRPARVAVSAGPAGPDGSGTAG